MPTLKEPQSGIFGASDLDVLEAAFAEAWSVLSNPKHTRRWACTREDVARR